MKIKFIFGYPRGILVLGGVVMILGILIGPLLTDKKTVVDKGPVIKVYGQTIKNEDFARYLHLARQATQSDEISTQVLDYAVTLALRDIAIERELNEFFAMTGMEVDSSEVDKIIRERFATKEQFELFMNQLGYKNEEEFIESVLKNRMWQKFLINKARELNITIPQIRVLERLEQITTRHIYIGTKDPITNSPLRTETEALQLVNELYQKVMAGEDFTRLVKEFSEDKGDSGYGPMTVELFKMSVDQNYMNAALALEEGGISKPVKATGKNPPGYYIIRMESRSIPEGDKYEEKYREIEEELLIWEVSENPVFKEYMWEILEEARMNMEILDPAIKATYFQQG